MNVDDLILISVDDHVIEPADMFDGHIPDKWRDRAPRVVEDAEGRQMWTFEGEVTMNIGLNAVAGVPPEEYGTDPTRFDQMRPGCYDVHERVRDMDANGVLASLNFPTYAQFCGQYLARAKDRDLALAVVQAYNDWHIDEWAGSYPDRLIPLAVTPLWDAGLIADEVRRVAAKGCHAITFSENPSKLGFPSLHTDHWDPVWGACADEGTVVCLHIGSSSSMPITSPDAPVDVTIALTPLNSFMALADLLYSPALQKFPSLKIALSEGGIGWVPYLLERLDYVYEHHHRWTGAELGGRLPSQIFRDHITTCFIDDRAGLRLRDIIGVDNITWECDYPHSDSTWPTSPELLGKTIVEIPDAEIRKIGYENAMRVFSFDPFRTRSRAEATVGALRARAADVDTALHHTDRTHHQMTGAEMAALAQKLTVGSGSGAAATPAPAAP
jgi:predicted TIM-barrel fold metal-dependent hydrolase